MSAKRAVNVYDFDHTIYRGDASLDFILYCMLRQPKLWKYLPDQAEAITRYIFGLWNRKQVKQVAFAFLNDLSDVDETVNAFWKKNKKNIKSWYLAQHSTSDVIISASPEFLLAPIVKSIDVQAILATNMDKHTGKITGENCRAKEKLRRWGEFGSTTFVEDFYSDSLSDMPLLEIAQHPYIVKKNVVIPLAEYKPSRLKVFKSPAFIRFLFVGGVNALLGVLLAYIISFFVSSALLAWVIGYALSLLVSYPLNAIIAFRHFSFSFKQFGSFCVSYLPNFLVQFMCVHVLTRYFGLYRLLAYLLAVIIAVPITYFLLSTRTFKKA